MNRKEKIDLLKSIKSGKTTVQDLIPKKLTIKLYALVNGSEVTHHDCPAGYGKELLETLTVTLADKDGRPIL